MPALALDYSDPPLQVCRENFEKVCQISFRGEAAVQTVRRCSRPLVKTCDGRGEPRCRLVFE